MEDNQSQIKYCAENPELGPIGTFAIVIRMPLGSMSELARMAAQFPGARIIYQRTSAGRLTIVDGER
ncbi:hypothetical protein [Methanomassiliicoccus luminyensis]|uniref:hypothetical protein n=1 Tax=Methanomassiliicoccus luminyensis TaxID=1080712 RepID=UPI0003617B29|nr:hypothetical protein [Methanomassiliicoccus luminyensis]